jgi:hypothetical protein
VSIRSRVDSFQRPLETEFGKRAEHRFLHLLDLGFGDQVRRKTKSPFDKRCEGNLTPLDQLQEGARSLEFCRDESIHRRSWVDVHRAQLFNCFSNLPAVTEGLERRGGTPCEIEIDYLDSSPEAFFEEMPSWEELILHILPRSC